MSIVLKDSFGQVIDVGDYVTFVTKTRYINAQSIGVVTKITPKGSVTIRAINTGGMTIAERIAETKKRRDKLRAEWEARGVIEHHDPNSWLHESNDLFAAEVVPTQTTLRDASSCVRLPAAPSMEIAQALS